MLKRIIMVKKVLFIQTNNLIKIIKKIENIFKCIILIDNIHNDIYL